MNDDWWRGRESVAPCMGLFLIVAVGMPGAVTQDVILEMGDVAARQHFVCC